jgi:hypothetical protein
MSAHSTLVLLKTPRSAKHFSDELAARAKSLALRPPPLHCYDKYLPETPTSEFARKAGFLSGILVRMREGIWLELAGLGDSRESLSLRCSLAERSSNSAEISSASFTCKHPNNLIAWTTHRGERFGFSFGTVISHTSARIWRG